MIDGRNKAYGTIDPANQVDWYTITIGEAQEIRFSTSKTLSLIDDGVAIADTEIGIYSNSGALLASNDDISFPTNPYSLVTFPNLAAGTYYVAVAGYNTTFGASNWAVSSDGQSGIGDYWLNITPEPASLALLALGGLVIARRRR